MNHQRLILFILVILFVIAALWSYSALPRSKTVSTLAYQSGQQAKVVAAATAKPVRDPGDGTVLKIALFEHEPVGFKRYHRNVFKPLFSDESKIIKKPALMTKSFPWPPPVPVIPVVVQPETVPLARFTFLGFLKKGSVKIIFLSKDNEILLVKKGDKIAGRYEATDISDQALTLKVDDTGDVIKIPLTENLPLAIAR